MKLSFSYWKKDVRRIYVKSRGIVIQSAKSLLAQQRENPMFKFFRKKRARESFTLFLMCETRANPALNLEDALDMYIEKYSLQIQHSLEEPSFITEKRTKLMILEEARESDPGIFDAPELQRYINSLQIFVETMNSLPPEAIKHMKKDES